MGGFDKLMKNTIGAAGRLLGFAPAPKAPQTAVYQTGGTGFDQAAALRAAQEEKLRREESARQAEESLKKSETEAALADERKKALMAADARRRANIAASGRAAGILAGAGELPSALGRGKSLLGA